MLPPESLHRCALREVPHSDALVLRIGYNHVLQCHKTVKSYTARPSALFSQAMTWRIHACVNDVFDILLLLRKSATLNRRFDCRGTLR